MPHPTALAQQAGAIQAGRGNRPSSSYCHAAVNSLYFALSRLTRSQADRHFAGLTSAHRVAGDVCIHQRLRRCQAALSLLLLLCVLVMLPSRAAEAREIGIAFIEDGMEQPEARLSALILQELQPLLPAGDTIAPVFYGTGDPASDAVQWLSIATADPAVDFIVATGFVGSQELYQRPAFSKPTFLLRVLDPTLTGATARDDVRNLRSYSTVNEVVDVFKRLKALFDAKRVAILLPQNAFDAQRSIGAAVAAAAKQTGIVEAQFLALDYERDIESQLPGLDAVILPPLAAAEQQRNTLLQALQRKRIPSYAVGGNSLVLSGALISDTVDDDERVLARRVALDMQLAINGEARAQGMRRLQPQQRTTINIDTARALGIDFSFDELMTARVVQGNSSTLALGFLSTIELATERSLGLRGEAQQVRLKTASLAQARAARLPQVGAQVGYTQRGEQLPQRESLAGISLSQTLYSATANAAVATAAIGVGAAEKSLEQARLDTIQQTASAYFQALQTQSQFETSLRDLALNRENLNLAEQRRRSGSGTGADIYRWQAVIAASENAVLRAFTANTNAQSQLAQLLNTRLQIPTTLADVDLDQPPFDLLHEGIAPYLQSTGKADQLRETSATRALAQSPELESAAADVAINTTQLQALKRSRYTPDLTLSAQYSRFLDTTPNNAGFELDDQDDWSVSLNATLPLWDSGSRRSRLHQFTAQRELAQTQLERVKIALWSNSGIAVNNLVANHRSIAISARAEEAARKSQQITQRAYRLGAASVTELLDTQNAYRDAQDNANIARYQYLAALVDFQALMGEMPMLRSATDQQQWLREFTQGSAALR